MLIDRKSAGLLYLIMAINSAWGLQYFLPFRESDLNLLFIGKATVALVAVFYFVTSCIYMLTDRLAYIAARTQYSWYATSIGLALWSAGYFLGNGCDANIFWGVWFATVAVVFTFVGYKQASCKS